MSPATHWFWILSRGAGVTALLLASATICYGLVTAGRMRRGGTADRREYHRMLALSTIVAIAFHGLVLLGDPFLHPDLADLTVPFVSSYETAWTTLGIVAGYAIVALGLSYYVRDRIGRRTQAIIHRLTVVAWAMGLVHALFEGTDAGTAWFIALVVISGAPVVALLALRLGGGRLAWPGPLAPRSPSTRPPAGLPG